MIVEMGHDPVDAGPLRYSRELEAMQRLYGVPFFQRQPSCMGVLLPAQLLLGMHLGRRLVGAGDRCGQSRPGTGDAGAAAAVSGNALRIDSVQAAALRWR